MGKKHPEKALSAVRVKNESKPGMYADGNCLYLVVDESGAKRWMLRLLVHGKRRDIGLGGLRTVSLAEARDEALKLRKIARAGGDPLAERREQQRQSERERLMPTFEAATREVHGTHSASFRNPKHAMQWLKTLEDYAFPTFGTKRVDLVDSGDVLKALSPIWIGKAETARRVKQRMKTVFDWAKAKGYRTGDNPTEGLTKVLPKHNRKHKHHAALPYAQVPAFITSLRDADAAESVKLAFEFLILCAARTSEVLFAKWSEIDHSNKTWTVPGERMKAKIEHRVPLSARCIEILKAAKEVSDGSEYIFPGRSAKKPLSDMAFVMCLRRMEQTDGTAHGFRSSFRDWASEKTHFQREVIEFSLAHTVENKTEASYFRSDLFEKRRELMNAWTAFTTAVPAKVVKMRTR